MTAPGPSSMDTSPQRDFEPILDRSSGRMAITVTGTPIDETPDGIAGWVVTTQRGKTSGSAETPASSLGANTRRKKARRSSVNESDEEEDLNMVNDADETASVSSISTQLSRTTDGQEGLNCGARFKKIYNRLNRQDRRINEISQKVDNVASVMNKFEARVEARITTGFEEMKLFMVQVLKEELSSLGLEVEIPLKIRSKLPSTRKHKLTDWNAFRQQDIVPTIEDLEEWTRSLVDAAECASTEIETDDTTSPMDTKAESYRDEAPERTEIGRDIARHLVVLPLPRNIHPQRNKERRVARARALAETHASDSTAVYVDAAKHQYRPHTYVAVVVRATDGKLLNACSVRATSAEQAEEAAIALALNGTPQVTTILSDSRMAIANFGRGSIGTPAARLLPRSKGSNVVAAALIE
ncbi:hypothetical protein MRX96_036651 [Rhipicephalus microplus]